MWTIADSERFQISFEEQEMHIAVVDGWQGTDSLQIIATDEEGNTDTAYVTIIVDFITSAWSPDKRCASIFFPILWKTVAP